MAFLGLRSNRSPSGTIPTCRSKRLTYRVAAHIGAVLISIISVAAVFRIFVVPSLVAFYPSLEPIFYDWALYGPHPKQSYVSFNLSSPRASVAKWDDSCADGLVLQDLHGNAASSLGPYITDMRGNLVWLSDHFGWAANLKVQTFQGQQYLTFWAGEKLTESGQGRYYMLDSAYRVAFVVSAVGQGLFGDLHEFKVTENGTALLTIYDRADVDLSDTNLRGRGDHIVDCIVQEVDIASGELVFEWRASDHLTDGEYLQRSFGGNVDGDGPIDYFHINSIEKDRFGNYLISVRHTHSLLYVDVSGTILWALGGPRNDFTDVSDTPASDFHWQHDARWQDLDAHQGTLTLFDNGIAKHHYENATYSQGRVIHLDFDNRTASLLYTYNSLYNTAATSQGSVQLLPVANDEIREQHAMVGWGSHAAFSEFSLEGELLCEMHFAASLFWIFEGEKSYRAIKTFDWRGIPHWNPSAKIDGGRLFVSWNGATEVAYWALQGISVELEFAGRERREHVHPADYDDFYSGQGDDFEDIDILFRDDWFESSFDLSDLEGKFSAFRAAALDEDGNVLRFSNIAVPPRLWTQWVSLWAIVVFTGSAALAVGVSVCAVVYQWRTCRDAGANAKIGMIKDHERATYSRLESSGVELEDLEET